MPRLTSVLLVDDDETANFLNKIVIERAGVTEHLLVAEDGAQALRALATTCQVPGQAQCPELILLDLNMPVLNGIEFLQAYQHLPATQRQGIVVMLLTSASVERDLDQLRGLPLDGILEKPLTVTKLQQLLDEYFPA
ncbi:response regulator [Hymenobacter sp. GOD-10R]|uniref:response regulator n=1 Tax=Hymenobacter sp. GOD-10R TaxID=3093922 RepID=UPI002D789158|nr:response regulator [Hymenobacter sp. GOD-10R]WRQ30838.1 response regulator [Hymenobacter sp. GOD-10R]